MTILILIFLLRHINSGMRSWPTILTLAIWLGLAKSEDCLPWGLRLSLGYHYSNPSSDHNLFIAFNTDVSAC